MKSQDYGRDFLRFSSRSDGYHDIRSDISQENAYGYSEDFDPFKELEKEGKKEITSDENKKELTEKLKIEAGLQKAEDDKRKELEEQIRKMQEMLSQMSK